MFVTLASDNMCLASSVRELTIEIDGPVGLNALRRCLSLTRHLTDLSLYFSEDVPVDLLQGLHFQSLEFFQTNLPHRHLPGFLYVHSHITELCLDSCQRGVAKTCPLQFLHARQYLSVECPPECVRQTAHPRLIRLGVHDVHQSLLSASTIFGPLRPPLVGLLYMTLDFPPDDFDLLQVVSGVAPQLRKLKLLEKPRPNVRRLFVLLNTILTALQRRRTHARRPWNDFAAWSRSLSKLKALEDFALRTASPFTYCPSSVASEKTILMRWVTINTKHSPLEHPTLSCLRLWYRSLDANNGIITLWSKYSGTWENIHRTVGPPVGAMF